MAQPLNTDIDRFISRWQSADGGERANYQLFVHELCTLLDLPTPDPAREDTRDKILLKNPCVLDLVTAKNSGHHANGLF